MESINNEPMVTLQQVVLSFDLTCMKIIDYQFMQSFSVTKLALEQLKQLTQKLPNYAVVNYDSL